MTELKSTVADWDGKHPLNNSWTLWYSDRFTSRVWEDCLKEVGSFNTAEDFWRYFNYLQPLSGLKSNTDISLFKKGISPMWEDEANRKGGRWAISLDRSLSKLLMDDLWMELVMAMVGEIFRGSGNLITGTVVNRREKATRISVWTRISHRCKDLESLGRQIRDAVKLPSDIQICFQAHEDCAKNLAGAPAIYRI